MKCCHHWDQEPIGPSHPGGLSSLPKFLITREERVYGASGAGSPWMKKLLLAVVAITGFIGQGTMATTELDMNDRPAMMQLADGHKACNLN